MLIKVNLTTIIQKKIITKIKNYQKKTIQILK